MRRSRQGLQQQASSSLHTVYASTSLGEGIHSLPGHPPATYTPSRDSSPSLHRLPCASASLKAADDVDTLLTVF